MVLLVNKGQETMAEKIIQANILEQSKRDLTTYAIYVARRRALPNPFDG